MPNALSNILNAQLAQRRAQMTHTGQFDNDAIRQQRWQDVLRAPGRLAQGAFTGLAGAPVDIVNMALQPLGLGSERPVGGSNYLASLINADTSSVPYQAGTMLPIGPEGLAVGGAKLAGLMGVAKHAGKSSAALKSAKTEFELAHEVAQRNAALPVEQGGLGLPPNNTAMDRAKAMSATGDDLSLIGGPSAGLRDAYSLGKKAREVNPDINTWAYTDEYKDFLGTFPWEKEKTPAWEAFYRAGKLNRDEPVMAIGSRYGEIPERGTSFNYRDQINERGVSMADVQNSSAAEWADPISKMIIEGYGRPKINVGGYLIDDVGADEEPLMVAAKKLAGDYVIDSGKKRSRFAAFDPMKRRSANILAGGLGGAIGLNTLADLANQQEYQ